MADKWKRAPKPVHFWIRVGVGHDKSTIVTIPPERLNTDFLYKTFHINVDYLKDDAEEVLWPYQWLDECKPKPYYYWIVAKELKPRIIDAYVDPEYIGRSDTFVVNVPHQVKERDLIAWIRAGIGACNAGVRRTKTALDKTVRKLNNLETSRELLLDDYHYTAEPGEEGNDDVVPEHIQKLKKFQRMKKKRQAFKIRIAQLKEHLASLFKRLSNMPVEVELVRPQGVAFKPKEDKFRATVKTIWELAAELVNDPVERTNSWRVRLPEDESGSMMDSAIQFDDWARVMVRITRKPTDKPLARYVGPGAEDIETDLDELEVLRTLIDHGINMREAYLVHLRDGMGASRGPLKDVYSGQWRAGLKHGRGSEIGLTGRYVGEFVNGVRSGVGKADLSNGDSWEGEFGIGHTPPPPERLDDTSRLWGRSCALEPRDAKGTPHGALAGMPKRVAHYKPQNVELIVDDTMGMYNPYAGIGVPHGEGVLTFADGSTYTGQMENGIPHGKGEYRARTGAIESGIFVRGVLHGYGTKKLADGTFMRGIFRDGLLMRRGVERRSDGELYEGDFEHGQRNGRGIATREIKGGKRVYEGYWKDGYKHGRGGVLTKVNKDGFGFELYGTWSFDLPLGRGGMETIRPKTAWGLRDHHAQPVTSMVSRFGPKDHMKVGALVHRLAKEEVERRKNLVYLGKKHRAKIRKRTAIGNSMAHKQWIRVRGVWRNHAVDWKDIVQRQYTVYSSGSTADNASLFRTELSSAFHSSDAGSTSRGSRGSSGGQSG